MVYDVNMCYNCLKGVEFVKGANLHENQEKHFNCLYFKSCLFRY